MTGSPETLKDPRPLDWMREVEFQLMHDLSCSLKDIDETDTGSLFGLLGYLSRKNAGTETGILTLSGKKYKKISADNAAWL